MLLWVLASLGLLLALAAMANIRRTSRRLDALTQSYWELRYDYTRLRGQVARLDPAQDDAAAAPPEAPAPAQVTFVPLSSFRKKDN